MSGMHKLILGLLILLAVGWVVGTLTGTDWSASQRTSTGLPQGSAGGGVGVDARLATDGDSGVIVARDQETLDALVKAAVADDRTGFMQVTASGKAFTVPNGTKIHTIDRTVTTYQVRILEGAHALEAGWVPIEYVKPL